MTDELTISTDSGVLHVVLNRPDEYNAISNQMLEGLCDAADRFDGNHELRVSIGLVHRAYADSTFKAETRAFCEALAKRPYELLGLAKLSIEPAADLDRAQARNVKRISNNILFTGAEHKALINAFLERQTAKRKARSSEN